MKNGQDLMRAYIAQWWLEKCFFFLAERSTAPIVGTYNWVETISRGAFLSHFNFHFLGCLIKVRLSQNEFIWRISALCTMKTLRAEILQIFWVNFGSNENFKICFRDLLTFSMYPRILTFCYNVHFKIHNPIHIIEVINKDLCSIDR